LGTIGGLMKNLFLLFILLPAILKAQNTIGFPDVINYSRHVYKAGLQNWDIRQDKNGVVYFANNEGLLSFDGHYWKLFPTPNKTIVHSVEIGSDNRIYVGGQDELGYFLPGDNGELAYHSLTGLLRASEKSFGDVWDIVSFRNDTYFRTPYKIFRLSNESITTYNAPREWSYLGLCNGVLYAHDYRQGIMTFANNSWLPLPGPSELPAYDPITSIVKVRNDSIIITTLKNGLYALSKNGIVKIKMLNSSIFEKDRIYAATAISDSQLALASNNNGIYITGLNGEIIQGFSRSEQLQNNNVLSIFLDNQHNLWLGLDNGIDFIAFNSAIKHISPMRQDGSGYTAIIHDNNLYAGTSNGLYSVPLQPIDDLGFSKGHFTEVAGSQGQVWSLAHVNNNLFLGHHEGAFLVNGNIASPLIKGTGFWNFIPVSASFPAERVVAGNYRGLQFLDFKDGHFEAGAWVPGFSESSRFVAIDEFQNTWVSHPYHGVFRLTKNGDSSYSQTLYTDKQGLPSALNNHIYKIKNRVLVATIKGVYAYDSKTDRFDPDPFYSKLLGSQGIRYLHEDVAGNTWFIHDKTLGVIDVSGKQPVIIYLPELTAKMVSGFEFIYCYDQSNIFLGAENGFYHINYNKYRKTIPDLKVQVRGVTIIDNKDSLLFGGYFKNVSEDQVQDKKSVPEISYSWKTIQFEFSSSLFGYQANLEYSFMLKGFDENWSEWSKRTEKEYTNLPAGDYTFQVKVRSNLGNESPVASYSFTILPPWYQTVWAKLVYLLLVGTLFYGIYEWQRRKFIRQQKLHEEEQKRLSYIHDLEINKTESELVAVKNEKLEAEISFKNSELASSAMHLVKKGELLTTIKTELGQLAKRIDNEKAVGELKKMIKSLSEDDHIDKEWENFARHFDTVHSDFVTKLKEKHPNISNNEMKLCAYLRMNLSSKEIAQLMNISVRGVEISRYRLRKKMGVTPDVNLFDYLLQFQ
jgi:ligand-binding sensor domain-containing protein/DNA-binding CsgD family transcriptional regulator